MAVFNEGFPNSTPPPWEKLLLPVFLVKDLGHKILPIMTSHSEKLCWIHGHVCISSEK